ncbi:uncharacterized protein [Dermacentor andersoni]|uniref:uncharacterized protein isoform X1 n=1 Tax=Dermacentor andersoni TaxID=34620 RepID=UPI002415AA75|nr:uncharacterized protein LOC129382072 isoform X1 [Dermacentor andersoni]
MAMFKLQGIPKDYFQYMLNIMHKEGHHYFYHDNAQYKDEKVVTGPDQLFVGFTIRLFLYNKDQSGHAKIGAQWTSKIGQQWRIVAEFRDKAIWYAGKTRFKVGEYTGSNRTVPEDTLYTLAIRAKTDAVFQALLNEDPFYEVDVENTLDYAWDFHIKAEGQILLGMSLTGEAVPRPKNFWGVQCALSNLWVPVGTVGVYTCALVDNTKENSLELTHANGAKTSHHFSHGNLPNGTLLHYTIRLSFRQYIISTDFDPMIYLQDSHEPNYINAYFSEALNIINFDADVPYT